MPTSRRSAGPPPSICEACGRDSIVTRSVRQDFAYGSGADAVQLSATVPVHHCASCGIEYTDGSAEDLRHAAVCEHLDVLTPQQIHTLRTQTLALSREDFSTLTGIGTASLARWESGSLIQSLGYDRYLRLLRDPGTVSSLRLITSGEAMVAEPTIRRFPSLDERQLNDRSASRFQLRRTG